MNPARTSALRPSPTGWLTAVAVIFAVQLALIWLMNEPRRAPWPARPTASFRLLAAPLSEEQMAATIFASDPTLFSEPSWHGFSGRAWLHGPRQLYATPERIEPPHWLALAPERLGKSLPALAAPRNDIPFDLAAQNDPPFEFLLMRLPPEIIRARSSVRMEGSLAERWVNEVANLPVWPGNQPAKNSEVQVAVDGTGQVVSARLLGTRGLAAADAEALARARNLRFRPSGSLRQAPIWGKVVFEWMTLPPTNSAAAAP